MPELPEVETVRRTLAPIVGARITRVWHSGLPLRSNRPVDLPALRRACVGAAVERVDRLGKYLLVYFEGRADLALVHLGMSGRLRVFPAGAPAVPHTHVVWSLADGRSLRYSDPRRFGLVSTAGRGAEREHPSLARIGVDPLTEPFSGPTLHALTRGSRQQIKTFLLDQRKVAGLGNIYAAEVLWAARIRPTLRAHRLSAAPRGAQGPAARPDPRRNQPQGLRECRRNSRGLQEASPRLRPRGAPLSPPGLRRPDQADPEPRKSNFFLSKVSAVIGTGAPQRGWVQAT